MFYKNTNQDLQYNIKSQLESLFVGAVINQGNLSDYARTKQFIGYTGGYAQRTLDKMQQQIEEVKRVFPVQYNRFRQELLHKLGASKPTGYFRLCDAYVRAFDKIEYMSDKELTLALERYARRNSW